jgi:hypothetical protein
LAPVAKSSIRESNVDDDDADGWAIASDADDEERPPRALPREVRRVRDAIGRRRRETASTVSSGGVRLGVVDGWAFGGDARGRDGGDGVGVRENDADVRGDGGTGDRGGGAMGGLVWEGDESADVCAGGGRGGVFDERVRDDDGCVLSVDMREEEWAGSCGIVCGVSVFGSVDAGGV